MRLLNSNIRIFFLSLRFLSFFYFFLFFLQSFQTQIYSLVLIGGYLKLVISLINCTLVTVVDVLTTIKTIVTSPLCKLYSSLTRCCYNNMTQCCFSNQRGKSSSCFFSSGLKRVNRLLIYLLFTVITYCPSGRFI